MISGSCSERDVKGFNFFTPRPAFDFGFANEGGGIRTGGLGVDDANGLVAPRVSTTFTTDMFLKPFFWILRDPGVETPAAALEDIDKPSGHRIIIHELFADSRRIYSASALCNGRISSGSLSALKCLPSIVVPVVMLSPK